MEKQTILFVAEGLIHRCDTGHVLRRHHFLIFTFQNVSECNISLDGLMAICSVLHDMKPMKRLNFASKSTIHIVRVAP